MAVITIGGSATNRSTSGLYDTTVLLRGVTATGTGTINSMSLWIEFGGGNVKMGTFYVVSGTNYTNRDSETFITPAAGSKQTYTGLNCNVVIGDILGYYGTVDMELDTTGGPGIYTVSGDKFGTTNQAYSEPFGGSTYNVSIEASGVTTGKIWEGITISKWNGIAISKINSV